MVHRAPARTNETMKARLNRLLESGCAVVLAIVFGIGTGHAQGAADGPPVEFDSIRVFAHEKATPGDGPHAYKKRFPAGETRFVSVQVAFKNLWRDAKASQHEVTIALYTFDNQLLSAHKKPMAVEADWEHAWVTQSYGWEEPGRWAVGTYRAKVWIGENKAGEAAFFIEGEEKDPVAAGVGSIKVEAIEFYEGGSFFRPGAPTESEAVFPRSRTRRVFWVVRGKNLLHGVRAQRPNIVGYFYRPDGTLLGEAPNRFLIAPEVEDAVLVEGIGWPTAGNWEPGTYRFQLEQDHRVVAERSFEITDPLKKPRLRPQVIHYGIIDAGAFAAGEEPPADEIGRKYLVEFKRSETRYIWTELVVVNNPNHEEIHTHEVNLQYLKPDGTLLGEAKSDFLIRPEWKTARHKASFGSAQAGGWEPGAYKVRIVIDGQLSRVVRFRVVE